MTETLTFAVMGEQIEIIKPNSQHLKSNVLVAVGSSVLIWTLHVIDQIKYFGTFYSLYVPAIILSIEYLKISFGPFSEEPKLKKTSQKLLYKLLKVITATVISTLAYFAMAILLGAPAFTQHEETLVFALFLCTMTFLNCLINEGLNSATDLCYTKLKPCKIVSIASAIGCWASAVVIPLDWSRWWQKWPIPCVMGALIGYTLGYYLLVVLSFGNKTKSKKIRKNV